MGCWKEALARNGETCQIGQLRVVEYLCAEQLSGQVAFVPLPANPTAIESLSCAMAMSERGVDCSLAAPK